MAPSIRERLGRRAAGQALTRPPGAREVMARSLLNRFGAAALLALGSCLISAAIGFAASDAAVYPLFYLWVSLGAFFFFDRRIAHAELAVAGLGYAVTGVAAGRWLIVIGSVWLAGGLVGLLRDRTQTLIAQLEEAAGRDPLTGLLNQHGFGERLEAALAQSNRSGREFSLVLGDLDGFKEVNDRGGDLEGDAVLTRLAPVLETAARAGDAIGRTAGDEFALLLDGADRAEAYLVVERLRDAVASTFAGDDVPVTASFGVAAWPDHGGSARGLLFAADCALYAAKGLGRDRTVIYSDQLRRAA